jgi:signal transduction histidine kinase
VLLGEVVDAPAEGTFWPSLMATALVAISVQPLRRRLVQLADRAVYGARAVPYEALADFTNDLQQSPGPQDLVDQVAESIGAAVGARQVEIRLVLHSDEVVWAAWPRALIPAGGPDLLLPVADREAALGELAVTWPPGRSVRPHEERLLRDFTDQLGRAFRNLQLESDLAERVEQLAAQTDELAASRRRLLSAQAEGRHRFESAISREVLPHLDGLPRELATIAKSPRLTADTLGPMIARTHEALAALRRLTRGVFPAEITHRGLVSALRSQLGLAGLAGVLRVDGTVADSRFDPAVETALYFSCTEFLRELDPPDEVTLTASKGVLVLEASGRPSPDRHEERMEHLADRVAPFGGVAAIDIVDGRAALRIAVPLDSAHHPQPGQGVGVQG